MWIFSFASNKLVDSFARELVADFVRQCPLGQKQVMKGGAFEKKVDSVMSDLYARARNFRTEQHLGVFKRARLAKTFQDELAAAGYPADVSNKITTALVASALTGK